MGTLILDTYYGGAKLCFLFTEMLFLGFSQVFLYPTCLEAQFYNFNSLLQEERDLDIIDQIFLVRLTELEIY